MTACRHYLFPPNKLLHRQPEMPSFAYLNHHHNIKNLQEMKKENAGTRIHSKFLP